MMYDVNHEEDKVSMIREKATDRVELLANSSCWFVEKARRIWLYAGLPIPSIGLIEAILWEFQEASSRRV